jgi:hypothetical protein
MEPTHYTDNGDVDLEQEEVILPSGHRLTDDLGDQIIEDVHAKVRRGRPSLTAPGARSPQLRFTVPVELKERLARAARAEHKRPSDILREALEARLKAH